MHEAWKQAKSCIERGFSDHVITARRLTYENGTFDLTVVHAGLHHCTFREIELDLPLKTRQGLGRGRFRERFETFVRRFSGRSSWEAIPTLQVKKGDLTVHS